MEKVNIEKVYTADKKVLYYLSHDSTDETMVLNEDELKDFYNQLYRKFGVMEQLLQKIDTPKPQLIIHETNSHGEGNVIYGDLIRSYTYDDGYMGDVKGAVEGLIEIGFIDPNDVTIIEGDEIYQHLNIK